MFEKDTIGLIKVALQKLEGGFDLPHFTPDYDHKKIGGVLNQVAEKLQDNYPYFHPLFAGQMLKPPHPVARAAYMLAMWINPNNHALDGGKASSAMEKEAVADLAKMVGFEQHLGHLTGGGTMANLEALWVASQEKPDQTIVASDQSHYTHERICGVLKIPFKKVATDREGKMDVTALEEVLKHHRIGTVVVTIGTTGLGKVDPLEDILQLQKQYPFQIHADAAYGGYFKLAEGLTDRVRQTYDLLSLVDSVVIDPHKQGLQPYGCGCVLFKNPEVAKYYLHDSPYTYFTSEELHLGEISLECSRPGAAAVALWATHQLMPLSATGDFANDLSKSRQAAILLSKKIEDSTHFRLVASPDTDIVVWTVSGASTTEMSEKAQRLFKKAEENHLYLSLYQFATDKLDWADVAVDSDHLVCLRSSLMKPEHLHWLETIWMKINQSL